MAKKGIIFETLNAVKTLDRSTASDGFMHLSGVFGVCGVRNNNHRVYEAKNYAKMVESMQDRLKKAPIPGELEHPQSMNITTENISHRIDSISIDENGVVSGEITLLNTPKGLIAQAIVEGGLPLFISSRAQGQVDKNGNVTLENLATYDLVGSPGFSQAELHLNESQCFESICESMCFIGEKDDEEDVKENNNEIDMDKEQLDAILEEISTLKDKVENLEAQNESLQEQLDQKQDIDLKQLSEGIQSWHINEYAPEIQKWIVNEYSDKVQNWVVEEVSPEIQKWIVEEYSGEVNKWVVEEVAPEIQNWIIRECAPEIQNWITEHANPELKNELMESLQNTISESLKNTTANKLESIDKVLTMLESHETAKPVFGRKANMINENLDEPKYIQDMPAEKRVKWNMASQDIRESIQRRASLYDFSKPGAIENFWENVNFEPVASARVNESLDQKDEWEKQIRASIRSYRNR